VKIDLHIHSKEGSDGRWPLVEIFAEAARRGIDAIAITDHDSIRAQAAARKLASSHGMHYVNGAELNITYAHPEYRKGKAISLDFLAYDYDLANRDLVTKLDELAAYREKRAGLILENLNQEFRAEGITEFTAEDMAAIQATADGSIGRPHIANYLISKGIVADKQEAFDRYLVRCDVPKLPLHLSEASELVRGAGGKLVLAHPNDPNGTSLVTLSTSLEEQQVIIVESMLEYIDGIECWHSRHDEATSASYVDFARRHNLLTTGGSDCHQQPVIMGTVQVPDVAMRAFARHN
jgi:predicted metal-dependent phosphoesterase TrpH